MAAALGPYLAEGKMELHPVDIDLDTALLARFDRDVPLLFAGDFEICRHEFDAFAFETWLRGLTERLIIANTTK